MNHWIIIPVILPAMVAPLIVLGMRNDLTLQRIASIAATVALLAVSALLLVQASTSGPQVYLLGNWAAPFGIVLVLDRLSALMVALTALLALGVVLYAVGSGWDGRGKNFHALFQFQLMGICGAFLTGDAFNLFVFFEILLIASYGLMIHAGGRDRLRAGVQYVVFNLAGSTLFLFALGAIYAITGTLNMADLAVKVADLPEGHDALLRVAGVLLLIVFAVKGALVPFQFWLPGTYALAPGPVAALFAVMTKVGAYAILRFYTLIFGPEVEATGTFYANLLVPLALVTLVVGMVGVLGARSLARLAAFAAIGSMGTLFLAMSDFTPLSTAATLYYLIHSTIAAALMFLVADMVLERRGNTLLVPRPPIARHGLIAALFFASAIAMAGMPPLSGFLGKLLILDALGDRADMAITWSAILITSLIAIVGMSRAGSIVFWKAHAISGDPAEVRPMPLAFTATFGMLGVLVAMTVLAGPLMGWLQETADQVHDTGAYIDAVLGLGATEDN
ncbi:multisubunit potassium/proton antiporter, PhaD subunit [Gemmobacter megaterium]|uniref:Multisubunit potassium/proton antiporter, PhaD subunit n=1 Tax=Gemmobacter megaterium TaxID=1086013 RepID=A0A1N7PDA0_9RHOB|nr:monovalent cation/H+ antiporter subunit D [Gemmobacter megaterium]GGE18954.1 monovalent cation/H+ antiporter subunit D [Gemmobacter megaterium]SIT08603.1 multisubunit potassium/proton antiporter, PhaD subunit [Gemmobacter megaterium]